MAERIVITGLFAVLCVYFLLGAVQGVAALIGELTWPSQ